MRDILTHTQDLAEAAAPDEVSIILRNAAESCNEAHNELLAAWQQSYTPWATVARILERAADQIDKVVLVVAFALITQGVQAEDFILRRELHEIEDQQDELIEQNEKIARQNEEIEWQIRKANSESQRIERQLEIDRVNRQIEDRRIQSERIKREVSEMSDGELEAWARAEGLKPDTARFGPVKKPEPAPFPPIDTQALLPEGSTTIIFPAVEKEESTTIIFPAVEK